MDLPLFLWRRKEETMTTYELWVHPRSGEVYAFRLDEGRVTGCRGPLTLREMAEANLADYLYEELPEAIRRVADSLQPHAPAGEGSEEPDLPHRTGQAASVLARALGQVASRRRLRRA
jgi:hypothetical protein